MTDHASAAVAAKVDLYNDDPSKKGQGQGDRLTLFLENVTAVQLASSKTHPFAFEIVEAEAVLVLSGSSQEESLEWIDVLKQLFFDSQYSTTATGKV